jgi:hypothetical protein
METEGLILRSQMVFGVAPSDIFRSIASRIENWDAGAMISS